jgi:hypothetical protein
MGEIQSIRSDSMFMASVITPTDSSKTTQTTNSLIKTKSMRVNFHFLTSIGRVDLEQQVPHALNLGARKSGESQISYKGFKRALIGNRLADLHT